MGAGEMGFVRGKTRVGSSVLRGDARRIWRAFSRAHLDRYGVRPRFAYLLDPAAIALFLEHADGDVANVVHRIERVLRARSRVSLPLTLDAVFLSDYADEVRAAQGGAA